jgi:hypothetical protein
LDETYDLRGKGVERFIVFESDRIFKLMIDQRQIQWGGSQSIIGQKLKFLAGVDVDSYDVWLRGLIIWILPQVETFASGHSSNRNCEAIGTRRN